MLFSKLGRYRYSPNLYCDIPKIMFILFSNIFKVISIILMFFSKFKFVCVISRPHRTTARGMVLPLGGTRSRSLTRWPKSSPGLTTTSRNRWTYGAIPWLGTPFRKISHFWCRYKCYITRNSGYKIYWYLILFFSFLQMEPCSACFLKLFVMLYL